MSKTLSTITQELITVHAKIEENFGEITNQDELELAQIEKEFLIKADHYPYRIDELKAKAKFLREYAEPFIESAKRLEKHADNMWDRLKFCMMASGKTLIEGVVNKFTLTPSKPSLILDEKLITDDFKKEGPMIINKDKIRKALELGEHVQGARFEQGMTLRKSVKK